MSPPVEISIPSTIVCTTEPKPFTLYNITLRLPLRSFVVQKRYSDFVALHDSLTSLVGAAPPQSLPAKSWFKSTVSSADLTEARREGLEAYLRSIAETPDRRWRDTSAWRAFLNLPSASPPKGNTAQHGFVSTAAIGAADPTTWLDIHRDMKACLHEARNFLARRDGAADVNNTTAAVEAGSQAKKSIIKAGTLINSLTDGLKSVEETNRLGEGEIRRRRDLLVASRVERDGLEKLSNTVVSSARSAAAGPVQGIASGTAQGALFNGMSNGTKPGGRVFGAPLPETDQTRELDNDGLLQLQRQTMADQDASVEELGAIVRRQKEMSLAIKDEVDRHIEMFDRLNDDVERVDGKMRVAKSRIQNM